LFERIKGQDVDLDAFLTGLPGLTCYAE